MSHSHAVLIRPSVILIIDDLEAENSFSVDWLLHSKEKIKLDPGNQLIESSRFSEAMKTRLVTPGGFEFKLNNEWPIDPKQDYPMVTAELPAKAWHFTAAARKKSKKRRIAAVMQIKENGKYPDCSVNINDGRVHLSRQFGDDEWSGIINISTGDNTRDPLLDLKYFPSSGETETIVIVN